MIGLRPNALADVSIGEQEQDANSALTELDKGLRSVKVGEQCEAIVRFPRLFEKYPFPILINSSFLKLSDVFRMGNNFLRLWVLRVCQQSEKHLDKILNVDEFLRRIFSVLHSNDPLARALALRTLGAVAGIIPERQNVHHAIRRGLDSQDNVEVDAAIYATTRFAAHSNAFAVAMCNKISDMVESESTAPERRDKLVRALRTVHGGAIRAEGVLKLLHSLMERYPSASFMRNSIAALTAIADDTVVHVPDQVEFLLKIVETDPRQSVRRSALTGLVRLAQHAALWPPYAINRLVACAGEGSHAMLCLQVMKNLVKCPALCAAAGLPQAVEERSLRQYCLDATLSVHLDVASTAATVLTDIVVHCYKESLPVEGADLMLSLESLVVACGHHDGKNSIKALKIVLRCLVQLSNAEPISYATRTAQLLSNQLSSLPWISTHKPDQFRLQAVLEGLAALGGAPYCPQGLAPAMPVVVSKLKEVASLGKYEAMETDSQQPGEQPTHNATPLVLLCTILLQERAGTSLHHTITDEWETVIKEAIENTDPWTKYRVARAALRYGHHNLAVAILNEVSELAPSEAAQRWLTGIKRAAQADAQLEKDGIRGLEVASAAWELAGDAASSATCGGMAGAWMSARACALSALAHAAAAARALCSQPPPAVAMATQAGRSGAARSGLCAGSLAGAGRALAAAAARYRSLATHSFHADDETLRHLEICEQTYTCLSQHLERISSWSQRDAMRWTAEQAPPANLEEKIMLVPMKRLEEITSSPLLQPTHNGVTHTHTASVLSCVRACSRRALWPLGAFCSRGDEPLVRLALTPAPKQGSEHAATIPASHHLAVHIEGLIKMPPKLKRTQKVREVKAVQLTVTVTPHPRTNEKAVELTNIPPILTARQVVRPVRDFFSGCQLVAAGSAALLSVTVSAAAIDNRDKIWPAPATTTLLVKAHEDPTSKSNVQAARRY